MATYKDQGISAEASEISIEDIDGLGFQKFEVTIYDPQGDVILNQLMYSKLINGLDFGVSISSNNTTDKNVMLKAWRSSHFGAEMGSQNESPKSGAANDSR